MDEEKKKRKNETNRKDEKVKKINEKRTQKWTSEWIRKEKNSKNKIEGRGIGGGKKRKNRKISQKRRKTKKIYKVKRDNKHD